MQPDTTQPSQAAREAAADYQRTLLASGRKYRDNISLSAFQYRNGSLDDSAIVQAFARFERDTEKRVRESLAERTVPVAWLHTLHMEGGQNYTRLLEDDGRDEDEPERTAFGLPGRDYSEEYTVTSEPLYRAARESLAGEANVERVALIEAVKHAKETLRLVFEKRQLMRDGILARRVNDSSHRLAAALSTLERTTDAG